MSQGRRTQPLPPDWEKTRGEVLEEDPTCYLCGLPGSTEVDHIVAVSEGGTEDRSNLAAVHKRCHATKTGREAARARARRYSPPHPPEKHPGIVEN